MLCWRRMLATRFCSGCRLDVAVYICRLVVLDRLQARREELTDVSCIGFSLHARAAGRVDPCTDVTAR
jgi:hypothetical protein